MSGPITIYRHPDGRFTVAEDEAARYAVGLPDEVLQALQDGVNERETEFAKRYLTLDMLKGASE